MQCCDQASSCLLYKTRLVLTVSWFLAPAGKAVEMSYDHKPEDEVELTRIKNAGGKVTMDGRVNGGLNLSRAIGKVDQRRDF